MRGWDPALTEQYLIVVTSISENKTTGSLLIVSKHQSLLSLQILKPFTVINGLFSTANICPQTSQNPQERVVNVYCKYTSKLCLEPLGCSSGRQTPPRTTASVGKIQPQG